MLVDRVHSSMLLPSSQPLCIATTPPFQEHRDQPRPIHQPPRLHVHTHSFFTASDLQEMHRGKSADSLLVLGFADDHSMQCRNDHLLHVPWIGASEQRRFQCFGSVAWRVQFQVVIC